MRTVALALSVLTMAPGCAQLRAEFIPPTGEALSVYDKTTTRTGVASVATGRTQIHDASGNLVATSTHYQNQVYHYKEREWYPLQGVARIDDESFYRITNDSEAAQKYTDYHQAGKRRSNAGIIVGAVGLALIGSGIGLSASGAPNANHDLTYVVSGAVTVGLITGVVGGILFFLGRKAAKAPDVRLIVEPERMKEDAQRYNAQLGAAPIR